MVLNTILKNIVKIGLIFFWLLIINGRGSLSVILFTRFQGVYLC